MKQSRNLPVISTITYVILQTLGILFEKFMLMRISSPIGMIALDCPMFNIPATIFHVIVLIAGCVILNKASKDEEDWRERRLIAVYRVILIITVIATLTWNHLLFDPRQFEIYVYAGYLSYKAFGQAVTLPFLLFSYISLLTSAAKSIGAKNKPNL